MIVTFEGINCVGKSTLVDKLSDDYGFNKIPEVSGVLVKKINEMKKKY